MGDRGTGVFGSVGDASQVYSEEKAVVTLESVASDCADSIYNIIFAEYDEEKN